MDTVIKVAAAGLLAAVAALVLKKDNPAGAFLIALAAGVVIVGAAMGFISPIADFLRALADAAGVAPEHFSALYKALAISIVSYVAAENCKDAGEKAVGGYIELAGGAAALYVSLPLMSDVFSLLRSFLR